MLEPFVTGTDDDGAGGGGGDGGSKCSKVFMLTFKLLFALLPSPDVSGTGGGGGRESSCVSEEAFRLAEEVFDTLLRLWFVLFCWLEEFMAPPICMCFGGILLLLALLN